MLKLIFLFAFIFLTNPIYAQNCPVPVRNFDIEVLSSPLSMDYSKSSAQIRVLKGESQNNLLGLYSSRRQIQISPNANSIKSPGANNFCSAVTKVKVKIILNPIIYVARESQLFSCTKQRVEQHELMHHQFEIAANQQARPYIENILQKHFGVNFPSSDKAELTAIVRGKNQAVLREVGEYFSQATAHKHAGIDTSANYQNESRYCPLQENIAVMNAIHRGN